MAIAVKADPLQVFQEWFQQAKAHPGIEDATAMGLATCGQDMLPSLRMVLLKGYDERGFVFYTNLGSVKAQELNENPKAALCFYWEALGKQIRIRGIVDSVSNDEADAYYSSRPLQSRIGAWASKQSQKMPSRYSLQRRVALFTAKFSVKPITRPDFWSGFRLIPEQIEFWRSGAFRLHDRLCYKRIAGKWETEVLYP